MTTLRTGSEPEQGSAQSAHTGSLSFRDVVKIYDGGTEPAVDNINLEIEAGEFITLLGPSGCGKTTTLRMVAGFETPTSGEILLDGKDIVPVPPNKRPISMVFQNYALFPHMSVEANVSYGLKMQRWRPDAIRDAVEIALTSMNLSKMKDRHPNQLSGGQQQRVALARAMVLRPSLMLFDEPLSNLDAKLRDHMRIEIRALQQRLGITSIYVTHDQSEAMGLSDRIVVMKQGVIQQLDSPANIYSSPANRFVADFIGRASFIDADVLGGTGETRTVQAFGKEQEVRAHPKVQTKGLLVLRPESVTVEPVTERGNGVVVSAMYYGTHVEYGIDSSAGTVLVSVPNPDPSQLIKPGVNVALSLASAAYLLPSEE